MVVQDDILYCMKTNKLKGDATIAVLHLQICHWSGQYEYKLVNHVKQMTAPAIAPPCTLGHIYMTSQQLSVLKVVKGGDDVTLCHKCPK